MKTTLAVLIVALLLVAGFIFMFWQVEKRPVPAESSADMTPASPIIITQLVERPAITAEVAQTVTVTVTNTAETEAIIETLQEEVKGLQDNLITQKKMVAEIDKRAQSLETARTALAEKLGTASNELVAVQQELSTLTATHTATRAELQEVREREADARLRLESLENQWNDLDELRSQYRSVKIRTREEMIAESKRRDALLTAKGNQGFLMRRGVWVEPSE